MKSFFKYALGLTCIVLFSRCSEPDDIVNKSVDLSATNLIQVETLSSYKLNDFLNINSSFSRYLPEKGYEDLLDIYKTTKSSEYTFRFYLEKKSAYGTWTSVNFGDKIIATKGKLYSYYENTGVCVFNPETNQYEFKCGIPLLETGEFRLSISNNMYPEYSNSSQIPVYIYTTIAEINNGYYNFTVN